MRRITAALLLLLLAVPVAAQTTSTTTVPAGKPLAVTFNHDGNNTTEYRVTVDGQIVATAPASVLKNGEASIAIPAIERGQHTVAVVAANADAFTTSNPLAVTSEFPAPSKPVIKVVVEVTVTVQ
jgi:hypothetical protein